MKFTKLTLVALLLALLVCAFVACGTPAETSAETDAETEASPATEATPETNADGSCKHVVVEEIDEPTCESRGYKREICSVCNEQLSVKPIDAVDHIEAAPATCTEGSACKFCGVAMTPATGHKIGEISEKKEATSTEAGYEKGACSVCGEIVTVVIPAGITATFDDQADGGMTKSAFAAFDGFEILIPAAEKNAYTVVTEGNNKYVKKSAAKETITFKDLNGVLGQGKFAFSMDVRFDGETGNSGLISVKDNADTEHRILSTWQGVKVRLGKDTNLDFFEPGNEWFNIRVVVDPATYDYEIWVDGEKVIYTTVDEATDGHLLWQLSGGEWTSKAVSGNLVKQGTIPEDPSVGVSRIYLFHWSSVPMSLDNMRLELLPNA